MKEIPVFLALLLILGSGSLKSQVEPPPNPGLYINILSGQSIEFVFDQFDEYINGIPNTGHSTYIRIGAIYNWKLEFKADESIFYGTDPAHQMELNNVGLVVESTGTNQADGSNIINNAPPGFPMALVSDDVTLLTKGNLSNKGYGIENSFTLEWEMGTRLGNMNPVRMLDQNLSPDTYTLNIILTLSVVY